MPILLFMKLITVSSSKFKTYETTDTFFATNSSQYSNEQILKSIYEKMVADVSEIYFYEYKKFETKQKLKQMK